MATRKTAYAVHPAIEYANTIIRNIPEKTGRSVDEWAALIRAHDSDDPRALRAWLKSAHGIGMTTGSILVDLALGEAAENVDPQAYLAAAPTYIDAMYAGPKSALRPIHDALLALGRSFGADVRVCPCRTIVPLYRNHVFAEIKPTTRTRVDFGLALKGASPKPIRRLIDTGGLAKGNRITNRFAIESVDQIDDTVRRWAGIAYELDGA